MNDPVEALVLDLLEWVGSGERSYREVIEVWRTSCPRLPVWEEANARGYLQQTNAGGAGAMVSLTAQGAEAVRQRRAGG